MNTSERLKIARAEPKRTQKELREHHQIELEEEATHKAQLALRRETETPGAKERAEDFQRKQAIYCDCPLMGPDWRDLPNDCEVRQG
ncbi:MAG TPA: hypothetical protein VN939_12380 [Chthoniobacterales bacterium]|jgi:hypothetical protein|nr:hypothetical protein [Chthoniobacterales bacterium]